MLVLAILRAPGDASSAELLARATGATLPQARRRALPPPPKIVAATRVHAEADRMSESLGRARLEPIVVDVDQLRASALLVHARSFRVGEAGLEGTAHDGQPWACPFESITALVRASRWETAQRSSTTFDRRVATTGGIVGALGSSPHEHERSVEESRGFVHVLRRSGRTIVLGDKRISFEGLSARRRQSAGASFAQLVELLRAAAPAAIYDERLRTIEGQRHLAAGVLDPRRFLDVSVAVLGRALCPETGPYR